MALLSCAYPTAQRRRKATSPGTGTTASSCRRRSDPRSGARRSGPCGASRRPSNPSSLHHRGDELLELAEVAALVDAVAVDPELRDDRVARVPVAPGLGIEPVQMTGSLLELLEHPVL